MKTEPLKHQAAAIRRSNALPGFAYFMEQGTGKTWCILADAERLYAGGMIEGLLVIAPPGVHTNWVHVEIPKHLNTSGVIAVAYNSGMSPTAERAFRKRLFAKRDDREPQPWRIVTMSYDSVRTVTGHRFAREFLQTFDSMIVLDESHKIKNHKSMTSEKVHALAPFARYRRIATGTEVLNGVLDLFSQMEFLESGCLGTTSFRAFATEFSDIMTVEDPMFAKLIERNPRVRHAIMPKKNSDGTIRSRNVDKLTRLIDPYCYRVRKHECLDLPDKIYTQQFFALTKSQRAAYDMLAAKARVVLEEEGVDEPVKALAVIRKLQQITSGFVLLKAAAEEVGGKVRTEAIRFLDGAKENPRLKALQEAIENVDGQFIVWASLIEEIRAITELLRDMDISFVEYHGGVTDEDRAPAVDTFQAGAVRAFVATQQAGGTGLTLTAGETVIYFSNTYNLGDRLQSEDRSHRIGTKNSVLYIDLIAESTIDEKIIAALRAKENIAEAIRTGEFTI